VQILSFLVDGNCADEPPSDWDAGHFVAFVGVVVGPSGTFVVVADSYRSLGNDAVHLQPVDRVADALRREGTGGGLLLVAAIDGHDDLVQATVEAGFTVRLWDNGSFDSLGPNGSG
jgi:hypothetical protein